MSRDLAAALRVERRAVEDELGGAPRPRRGSSTSATASSVSYSMPSRRIATTRPVARSWSRSPGTRWRRCGRGCRCVERLRPGPRRARPAFVSARLRSRCSASASWNPARSTRTPYSAASSTVRSIGKPYVSWSRNATSPGQDRRVGGEMVRLARRRRASSEVSGISASSSRPTPASSVRLNWRSSRSIDAEDLVAALGEVRVGVAPSCR